MTGSVHIDVWSGTAEAAWAPALQSLPPLTGLPGAGRVVIVAPHPDDEVLGCGGLVVALGRAGLTVEVVGVTDGEASHPSKPRGLAARRRREAAEADRRLGVTVRRHWLALPDGSVAGADARLDELLGHVLAGSAQRGSAPPEAAVLCVAPFARDGHPDHEATGRAALAAADRLGVGLIAYPVWAWHWAQPDGGDVPLAAARRLPLDDDQVRRKAWAIAAHRSQLEAPGPVDYGAVEGTVLTDAVLAHFRRPFEVFFT